MDHINVFFAQFTEREEMVRAFVRAGTEAAGRGRERGEQGEWDPAGGPERIGWDKWGVEGEVPGERRGRFEVGRRVRSAFEGM